MGSDIGFTCRAFPDEHSAIAVAKRVSEVLQEMASTLELSMAGLDGVTIAYDYDVALRELNRGFQSSGPLTATLDDFAGGVAMSPLVMRDGNVKSHILLSAGIVPLIDSADGGVSGKYLIAHELAHAHEHYFRDKQLPGTLLQQTNLWWNGNRAVPDCGELLVRVRSLSPQCESLSGPWPTL